MTATNTRVNVSSNVGPLTLYVTDCSNCGVIFAIEASYDDRRRSDGRGFHCPNGHVMAYEKSEADRLREQLKRTERRLESAQWQANMNGQRALEEKRRAAGYKGHLTRIRNRIANGVCPCCQRHFTNVERHIKSQHPAFVEKATEAIKAGERS